MKDSKPLLTRLRRFISDRLAYRETPNHYVSELIAFGILAFIAGWPIVVMADTMARYAR